MGSKATVLHVINALGSGGAESLLVTNLRNFTSDGFEHVVVTVYEARPERGDLYWAPFVAELGIPIVSLGCRGALQLPLGVARLASLARRHRPAVIHSHLRAANLVSHLASRVAGAPVVSSIHSLQYTPEVLAASPAPRSYRHALARNLEAASLRVGNGKVVAVGRAVAESVISNLRVDPRSVRIVYNPVDLARLDGLGRISREQVLGRVGISEDAVVVLNVARVVPGKGHRDVVLALASAPSNVHLVVAGRVGCETTKLEIETAARSAGMVGRVHLLGERRDVAEWLSVCDVFAFPSYFEGLPVSLAEAACSGCAIVASDIGPHREVVDDKSALFFNVGDVPALASSLAKLISNRDLRQALGAAAKARARKLFAPESSVTDLEALYAEVLSSDAV